MVCRQDSTNMGNLSPSGAGMTLRHYVGCMGGGGGLYHQLKMTSPLEKIFRHYLQSPFRRCNQV